MSRNSVSPITLDSEDDLVQEYENNPHFKNSKSILRTEISFLDVIGSGKNQKEAYNQAFAKLKDLIYQKHNNFIIHLEPLDVIPLSDLSDMKTKRIMGLVPHKALSWEINLRIFYQVKFIEDI